MQFSLLQRFKFHQCFSTFQEAKKNYHVSRFINEIRGSNYCFSECKPILLLVAQIPVDDNVTCSSSSTSRGGPHIATVRTVLPLISRAASPSPGRGTGSSNSSSNCAKEISLKIAAHTWMVVSMNDRNRHTLRQNPRPPGGLPELHVTPLPAFSCWGSDINQWQPFCSRVCTPRRRKRQRQIKQLTLKNSWVWDQTRNAVCGTTCHVVAEKGKKTCPRHVWCYNLLPHRTHVRMLAKHNLEQNISAEKPRKLRRVPQLWDSTSLPNLVVWVGRLPHGTWILWNLMFLLVFLVVLHGFVRDFVVGLLTWS